MPSKSGSARLESKAEFAFMAGLGLLALGAVALAFSIDRPARERARVESSA